MTVGSVVDLLYIGLCCLLILTISVVYLVPSNTLNLFILSVPFYFLAGLFSITWLPFRIFTNLVSGLPKRFLVAAFFSVVFLLSIQLLVPATLFRLN